MNASAHASAPAVAGHPAPIRNAALWDAAVTYDRRDDGTIIVGSASRTPDFPARMTDRLVKWASEAPDRTYITEANRDGTRRGLTYAETLTIVRRIASGLLKRGLSADRPIMILSGNDIEHALLTLAAQYIGVPTSPISTAYSLVATEYDKVKYIFDVLTPGLVFAADGERFSKAIQAVIPDDIELLVTRRPIEGRGATLFADLAATPIDPDVEIANAAVGPDTIAKFLFTSGSTGAPKGVINTQRMLCVNQVQIADALKFLSEEPPVILDWLPWNHTFGGNHNMGIALYHGGTFHIDAGKPVASGIEPTVAALRSISPTIYFNVPKGFESLLPYLRNEPELAKSFFAKLNVMFFAGASLSQHILDELDAIALETCGETVMMLSSLGSTETAPAALMVTRETLRAGAVGIPMAGIDVKLVPNQGKLEARLKGPSIMPGYWRNPDLTAKAFDADGYYLLGDALRFVDEARPELGFIFDGRVSEDFKLATGTWVSVGPMRAKLILALAPLVKDVVIAGHDRDDVGALIIAEEDEVLALTPDLPADTPFGAVIADPRVTARFQAGLDRLAREATGSSSRVQRLTILATPPSIDANEVTDKGSINQRAVLTRRADIVEDLYSAEPSSRVLLAHIRS